MSDELEGILASPVPKEVADAICKRPAEWTSVLDQSISWNPSAWRTAKLEGVRELIEQIASESRGPSREGRSGITRADVVRLASGGDPVRTFLATMIWGFGPTGYGAARVGDMVRRHPEDLAVRLDGQITAAALGPEPAWDAIHAASHKIHGLGAAFGTKLAYFAALAVAAPSPIPLIADQNTSWAMYGLVGLRRSVELKSTYLAYVTLAHRWATERGWTADDAPWALFQHGPKVPRR